MTTATREVAVQRPADIAPPTDVRPLDWDTQIILVPNPWTFHVRASCAVAAVVTVGVMAGAAVEQVHLDIAAGVVLGVWALFLALVGLHTRHHNRPPTKL